MRDTPVVFITGAARRIGACIVSKFHSQGFNVIIHYHQSAAEANQLVKQLNHARGDSAVCLQADLTDAEQVKQLSQQVLSQYSRLDVLVNNASSFYATEFGKTDLSQWRDLIDTNLRAAFFLIQDLRNELAKREGAIVNIVDTHADKPLRHHSVYSIAKAGVKAMTRSLALELAPAIRVNGVSPGAILWQSSMQDDQDPKVLAARDKILQQIPLGHLGKPEQIADAVYFLASEGSYLTGQVIRIDGGRSLS
ncbi:MAG: pteridine reductase [Proteobacteria bacterium]|nr:pteridine reductase [Pseudomonadota bacterium]